MHLGSFPTFLCIFTLTSIVCGDQSVRPTQKFDNTVGDRKRLAIEIEGTSAGLSVPGNTSITLNVTLGMTLQRAELNLKAETLSTTVWMHVQYVDQALTWEPESYGGLRQLSIPAKFIYQPDLMLYNSALMEKAKVFRDPDWPVVVRSDGSIDAIMGVDFLSTCQIEFDSNGVPHAFQNCTMKFGSWTYDGLVMDVLTGQVNLDTFLPQYCVKLLNLDASRSVVKYDCCAEPYVDITFKLRFQLNLESAWCLSVFKSA